MEGLKLLEAKIEKLSFVNDIFIPNTEGPVDIEIGTNISSTVNYNLPEKKCKCMTTVEVKPTNYEVDFSVEMCIAGIFDLGDYTDTKEIHVEACRKLFPHVQSRVTSFMTLAGIPNFIVEEPQLDIKDVKVND